MHNQFKTQKFKHLMLAMGPRDLNSAPYSPVHCSSHSMTSFQSSELTELPVVENSQLFAQRAHSARYAPNILCLSQRRPGLHERCLEVTAAARLSNISWAAWVSSSPSQRPLPDQDQPALSRLGVATHPHTNACPLAKQLATYSNQRDDNEAYIFHMTCRQAMCYISRHC